MRWRDLTELEPRTQLVKLTVNTIKKPPVYTGKGTQAAQWVDRPNFGLSTLLKESGRHATSAAVRVHPANRVGACEKTKHPEPLGLEETLRCSSEQPSSPMLLVTWQPQIPEWASGAPLPQLGELSSGRPSY